MPLYDIQCLSCDDTYEVSSTYLKLSSVQCRSCEGATKQIITPPNIIFSGGFEKNRIGKSKH